MYIFMTTRKFRFSRLAKYYSCYCTILNLSTLLFQEQNVSIKNKQFFTLTLNGIHPNRPLTCSRHACDSALLQLICAVFVLLCGDCVHCNLQSCKPNYCYPFVSYCKHKLDEVCASIDSTVKLCCVFLAFYLRLYY